MVSAWTEPGRSDVHTDLDGAAVRRRHGPPGWPAEVPPAQVHDWQVGAVTWLLDQAPPEYRGYPAVLRHPLLLAWLVDHHVQAQGEAVRRAVGTARRDLSDALPPEAAPQVFSVLEQEELRLRRLRRSVGLVYEALSGVRHVPRL